MIRFEKDICCDLGQAIVREWLETNGIGSFACSTVSGINTRRYHGLLVAATKPPVGRMLLVSKFEEVLTVGGERFELSANEYQGAIFPRGFEFLIGFRLDPWPIYTYQVSGVVLEKSIFMPQGSNTTVVSYRVLQSASDSVTLELRPLIGGRDYHATTHENDSISREYEEFADLVSLVAYPGLPRVYFAHSGATVTKQGYWYRSFLYRVEQQRGLDCVEDLFNPFSLTFELTDKQTADVVVSTSVTRVSDVDRLRREEKGRRDRVVGASPVEDDFVRQLTVAADQFIAQRDDGYTVMAGYPWFTDWGRDTMVALPGLTLFTGQKDVAKAILRTFAHHVDRGMLPNRFPDAGEQPEFNTVDATLWYFEAVRAYVAATNDFDFVKNELYPVLQSIIDWHVKGTRYSIGMLDSGLLNAGEHGVQLTWMDAKIGDWVVTPRIGKPVEIQALWYNALRIMADFASLLGDQTNLKRYRTYASLLQWTFNRIFWNEKAGCLYDVVNGTSDESIRPNQIFAVSLHHSMLTPERAKAVVNVVEEELLTPYGLRTLSPKDPMYISHYTGGPVQRDSAYHQGTVWPWLLGPFISAYLKVSNHSAEARSRVAEMLSPLRGHLSQAGLGQISEVFDGDPPYVPGGCFAQAWSVAELLRAITEGVRHPSKQEAATATR